MPLITVAVSSAPFVSTKDSVDSILFTSPLTPNVYEPASNVLPYLFSTALTVKLPTLSNVTAPPALGTLCPALPLAVNESTYPPRFTVLYEPLPSVSILPFATGALFSSVISNRGAAKVLSAVSVIFAVAVADCATCFPPTFALTTKVYVFKSSEVAVSILLVSTVSLPSA